MKDRGVENGVALNLRTTNHHWFLLEFEVYSSSELHSVSDSCKLLLQLALQVVWVFCVFCSHTTQRLNQGTKLCVRDCPNSPQSARKFCKWQLKGLSIFFCGVPFLTILLTRRAIAVFHHLNRGVLQRNCSVSGWLAGDAICRRNETTCRSVTALASFGFEHSQKTNLILFLCPSCGGPNETPMIKRKTTLQRCFRYRMLISKQALLSLENQF